MIIQLAVLNKASPRFADRSVSQRKWIRSFSTRRGICLKLISIHVLAASQKITKAFYIARLMLGSWILSPVVVNRRFLHFVLTFALSILGFVFGKANWKMICLGAQTFP
jgi:hypothetical protein